jgi:membrane-associated protease RseP (regulator of RpoE activity)
MTRAQRSDVTWSKTFSLAFAPERVWDAYFAHDGLDGPPDPGASVTLPDAAGTVVDVTAVEPASRIAWTETAGDATCEMAVVFEAVGTGTRLTVTRYGFGEGADFEVYRTSHELGWTEHIADLALYLHTGVSKRRHLAERCATGVVFADGDGGLEVVRATEGSLGTEAGLLPGDVLVEVDGAAVYSRSDLWLLTRLYEPGREVTVGFARGGTLRCGTGHTVPASRAVVGELGLGPRVDA